MRRPERVLIPVALLGTATALLLTHPEPAPAEAPAAPKVERTVPHAKFLKVVALNRKHRTEAKRWKRTARHSPSVREALDIASIVYGTPRGEIERVAFCESRLNPRARNRTPIWNGEHATGLLQTIPSTFRRSPFRGLDIYSPYANALAGAYIWSLSRSWREWHCKGDGRTHG